MIRIIDLSSANNATEAATLAAVLTAEPPSDREQLRVHARWGQVPELADLVREAGGELFGLDDGLARDGLANALAPHIAEAVQAGELVKVLSFSPAVKAATLAWADRFPSRVKYMPLSAYLGGGPNAPWDPTFMDEDEAVRTLTVALARAQGGSVPKANVRMLLEAIDARFGKQPGTFAASPGFITAVVRAAEQRGAVATAGIDPRVVVTITEQGMKIAGEAPDVGPSGPDPTSTNASRTRSQQFMTTLMKAKLGPYHRARGLVYDEMERLIEEQAPVELGDLIATALSHTDKDHPEIGEKSDGKFPWSRLEVLIRELMRARPVAITEDGQTVAPDMRNDAVRIKALDPAWRQRLDGVLIISLVDAGLEIVLDDFPDIAGAIYGSHHPEVVKQVRAVVAHLLTAGELEETPDGRGLRRPPTPPGMVVVERPPISVDPSAVEAPANVNGVLSS